MKEIKYQKEKIKEIVAEVVGVLDEGGVVVLATDTIYGLHCLADSEKAIKKVIKIKERPADFGFVHLMKSYCMVHDHAFVSKKQDKYLRTVWPATTRELHNFDKDKKMRPTTVILKSRENLPKLGRGGLRTIAIRLPKDRLLIEIMKMVNKPLISSSLNISGQGALGIDQLESKLKTKPDLVINSGKLAKKKASRLLDVINPDKIKVIRK